MRSERNKREIQKDNTEKIKKHEIRHKDIAVEV